ncbi:MAG: hypothetical protein F6K55_04245 [Moorea sp. SIO4A3]|nr:hypothetical protein [Moorena sp. SIO4A3]
MLYDQWLDFEQESKIHQTDGFAEETMLSFQERGYQDGYSGNWKGRCDYFNELKQVCHSSKVCRKNCRYMSGFSCGKHDAKFDKYWANLNPNSSTEF